MKTMFLSRLRKNPRLSHSTSSDSGCSDMYTPRPDRKQHVAVSSCCPQDMVSVETFVDFVRKRDLTRIKHAIRETSYDLDTQDDVSIQLYSPNLVVILVSCAKCDGSRVVVEPPVSVLVQYVARDLLIHSFDVSCGISLVLICYHFVCMCLDQLVCILFAFHLCHRPYCHSLPASETSVPYCLCSTTTEFRSSSLIVKVEAHVPHAP